MRIPLALLFSTSLGVAACDNGPTGPALQVNVDNTALAGQSSPNACNGAGTGTVQSLNPDRVRFTVRSHQGAANVVCDAVADGATPPNFGISAPSGSTLDVFVETFQKTMSGDAYVRTAMGSILGVDSKAATLPTVHLQAAEAFRCLSGTKLSRARAFHTATQLPNGQILLVGGVNVAPTGDGSTPAMAGQALVNLYLHGVVEVYDPATRTFLQPRDSGMATPRAFHTAVLLSQAGDPTFKVLLVGGLTIPPGMQGQPALRNNRSDLPPPDFFRFVPMVTNNVAAAPAELLTYDPAANTITRAPVMGFDARAFAGGAGTPIGGVVTVGGQTFGGGNITSDSAIDVSTDGMKVNMGSMPGNLVGPGVIAPSANTAYVIGGVPVGSMLTSQAFSVNLAGVTPTATPITFDITNKLWFPTLTTLGTMPQLTVLVSGALENTSLAALDPAAIPPEVLTLATDGSGFKSMPANLVGWAVDCSAKNDHYRPVAFNVATPLPGGRVLLTGGTPRNSSCNDCENGDNSYFCATHQAAVFNVGNGNLTVNPASTGTTMMEGMQIARFGHTVSPLADGTFVIIGGLSFQSRTAFAVTDAEFYNPIRRKPPQVPVTGGASIDADDPIFADLAGFPGAPKSREPGTQAHDTGSMSPSLSCPVPQ